MCFFGHVFLFFFSFKLQMSKPSLTKWTVWSRVKVWQKDVCPCEEEDKTQGWRTPSFFLYKLILFYRSNCYSRNVFFFSRIVLVFLSSLGKMALLESSCNWKVLLSIRGSKQHETKLIAPTMVCYKRLVFVRVDHLVPPMVLPATKFGSSGLSPIQMILEVKLFDLRRLSVG